MTAPDPAAFRERALARLRGEVVEQPRHDDATALGRKRNRNTVRNGQRRKAITPWQWKRTLEHFGHACAYCGVSEADKALEKEHFLPLKLGGNLGVHNIVPSCLSCNRRKFDTHPREWLADQPEKYAAIVEYLKVAR